MEQTTQNLRVLSFEVAGTGDFDQIFALNYATFVEEIPQHLPNSSKRLVDRFHDENTYVVARLGEELVGMVAMRSARPFSLDAKLANLGSYLPPHRSVCEVRLLCVKKGHRRGPVFAGLMKAVMVEGQARGYDLGVVSGTTRELRLYRHMGFVPFGPEVGTAEARYQPMYVTMSVFERETAAAFTRGTRIRESHAQARSPVPISFLPGPVAIAPEVRETLAQSAVSHRSESFADQLRDVRGRLSELTGASCATLMLGSGTLANDVVAGQIWRTGAPGVVVSDGEFGRRLVDHAERWSLRADVFERAWGAPWPLDELARFLEARPGTGWLWIALCETSTGALRDLGELRALCAARGVDLFLDAVSAVGATPLDLNGVRMASAVSGKALGAYPGLAVVLHHGAVTEGGPPLPRYLDLALYEAAEGVAFTQSSNLVGALQAALARYRTKDVFRETAALALHLRRELRRMGFKTVIEDAVASPAVTTLALPASTSARALGDRLGQAGLLVSYESQYLLERNWLQICLMGAPTTENVTLLLNALASR